MISNKTPYRLPSKYELLVQQAFRIVRTQVLADLDEAQHLSHLGVPTDKAAIEKYYYLIYYLIDVRQKLDQFLTTKDTPCFTDEEWESVKEKYLIDCILEEGVCDKYTNDIINTILDYPRCSDPETYEWVGEGSCDEFKGEVKIARTTLFKKLGTIVINDWFIPIDSTLEQFQSIVNDATLTQEFLDTRYIDDEDDVCCIDELFTQPEFTIETVTNDSFSISWTSDATSFDITLAEGSPENIIATETTSSTSKEYTGLNVSNTYYFTVTVENCAGETTATQVINTLPYFVIINVCTELENQLTITGANLGSNTINVFEQDFSFSFEDATSPYYEVTSVTINGIETIDNVIFNKFESGIPVGGTVNLFSITSDLVIEICGKLGDFCAEIDVEYTDDGTDDFITIS